MPRVNNHQELEQLDRTIGFYRGKALAETTKATYRSSLKCYLNFCKRYDITAAPASLATLSRYIAYLATRIAANSIPRYLAAVRMLHLESGLENPLLGNWHIDTLLKGIKRDKGTAINQKNPITPEILQHLRLRLNLDHPRDIVFWAACLTLFFGFFRKANVLVGPKGFSPDIHLTRADIHLHNGGIIIHIKWSKTIQFRERVLRVPLPCKPDHPLCPSTAVLRALAYTNGADPRGPAFVIPNTTSSTPLTQSAFTSTLKGHLAGMGLDKTIYSGHSFRRGGATWAFSCGLPGETIQLMGDWASDCYKRYLDVPMSAKLSFAQKLLI